MTNQRKNELIQAMIGHCQAMLDRKGTEYAPHDDVMHNFVVGANLLGIDKAEYLTALMTKHLVSITDMSRAASAYTDLEWQEKIGDIICYLLLLWAMVADGEEATQ